MQPSVIGNDEDTLKHPAIVATQETKKPLAHIVPQEWLEAGKQVLPIYLSTHLAFLVLTWFSPLFKLGNFSGNNSFMTLHALVQTWFRWDSGNYTYIAMHGYQNLTLTAFFPLFPLLERALTVVVGDPFVAGLIISNVATFLLFLVLYRLVERDFDRERAWRTVFFLAVFPTAFFLAAAYNESIFLLCSVLSLYWMRQGRWWLAGLAALFAGLTRSAAVCLAIPFAYEYLRQHQFHWRAIGRDVLAIGGTVGGVLLFGFYCYLTFHDPLAFSQAQRVWGRQLSFPWLVFWEAYGIITHSHPLTFDALHVELDLGAITFMLIVQILMFVGPWKLAKEQWSYAFYSLACYLLVLIVPETGRFPLSSLSRFMLELFPAFILLAAIGKQRTLLMSYLTLSLPLLAFLLLQWLTGFWMV